MKLADFDYNLPRELIAQYPLRERDSARFLVLHRKTGAIEHRVFKDIVDYISRDELLVLNNTKVLPCRLFGLRTSGGRVEVLLLSRKRNCVFDALIKPARIRLGEKILFNGGEIYAQLTAKNEVTFNINDRDRIYKLGVMPLPPYIKRKAEAQDDSDYQTVYAKEEGAVASPTAGLHFSSELIDKMLSRGIGFAYLTLHVGCGTFRPVKCDDIRRHIMEPEYFNIPIESTREIERARLHKKRIFAVGTTSLRALETHTSGENGGYTDLFIYPGYKFKIADALITNFHLPRTTLFMLVCAFAGEELAKEAYREAIKEKYRFYSYGDAMLII